MKKVFVLATLLSACGKSESDVQWGALRGDAPSFNTARTLLICGDAQLRKVANDAIWEWNNARGKFHQVSILPSCGARNRYDASVYVRFGACEPPVVGYHTQSGNHHDITICNGLPLRNRFQVMAHEIGHAYSLCDQYSPGDASMVVFHPNCGYPRSARPARSIMGGLYAGSPTQLTQDDIDGIRALNR